MGKTHRFGVILVLFLVLGDGCGAKPMYSWRLIHRFSDEARSSWVSRGESGGGNGTTSWPEKKSFGHMRMLLENDLKRQRLRLGAQNQVLVTSQGGRTVNYGNDMGWLHYTWIDIGMPNNSFLVALDTGSDMFWVPCDCIECAPLSLSYYNMLEKELGEYSPSHSSSSKRIPCSHELCELGPNCDTPKAHCPYTVNYLSDDTSSSGFLFEDLLHLASVGGNKQQSFVQASIIIGCGSKQTGQYLDGVAPDGVMGLGPGDISVPSLLAKSGLIPHSFSFCYDKSYSGRLYFGDQGPSSQKSTSLLPLEGNSLAYIVEVETYCVGSSCLNKTGNKAQVDTGSSFTYLPSESYEQVASEFHRQANATRITIQGFENCYKARALKVPNIPSMKLVFSMNQSLLIENPMFHIADDQGGLYCLGIQRIDGDIGLIGQNFLMGYRMVFDWEKLKLGWSNSNCQDIASDDEIHSKPPPSDASPNPLPTNEQQQNPHGHAVPPAVAGKAPPKPSAAYHRLPPYRYYIISLLLLVCTACMTRI
ncbi:aspartic proteinase-like protein 1 isoform X1 [Sesamum indicum]|uniref:Aspartic proteinase-like protein 1 isoform X1 n=1 Tax=Sesamum indicum TaxID=4182 RepID=A0A6I9UDS4_SESIN|nr:aspartic proteinase-like protein 1 isoform X1 [Sesamum indicum]